MMVILQEDVQHLGETGDIVRVKDGYARNYLVPRGFAVVADEKNVKQLEHYKRIAAAKAKKKLVAAR
jgi:large subunit ribosomal protein L9